MLSGLHRPLTSPGGHRLTIDAGQAARPLERAQLVWRRALELAGYPEPQERFTLALILFRAAHRDPATMAHALRLGRTHLRLHPSDDAGRRGVSMLAASIALLGAKPRTGDLPAPRR